MQKEEAKAIISKLVERFAEHRKDYHLSDYNEQKARQDFINPFWKALGWAVDNKKPRILNSEEKINQLAYALTPEEITMIERTLSPS